MVTATAKMAAERAGAEAGADRRGAGRSRGNRCRTGTASILQIQDRRHCTRRCSPSMGSCPSICRRRPLPLVGIEAMAAEEVAAAAAAGLAEAAAYRSNSNRTSSRQRAAIGWTSTGMTRTGIGRSGRRRQWWWKYLRNHPRKAAQDSSRPARPGRAGAGA